MKKFFLILAALVCAAAAQAAQAAPATKPDERQLFSVSASAEINVKPDRAHMTLGVSERSKNLHGAKERMSEIMKKAIAFCKAKGIQDKHIQTSYISIHPEFYYDDNKEMKNLLRHYALAQSITVTLENTELHETLLYGLLDLGINSVHDISFSTSELRKYRDEARLAAIKAAQEKAKLLAEAAGLKLGKAVNLQEGPSISPAYRLAMGRSSLSQNVMQEAAAAGADMAGEGFALGTIPVRAEVTILYELE